MKITKLLALIALALIPQFATADVGDSAAAIAARVVSAPSTKIAIKSSKNKNDSLADMRARLYFYHNIVIATEIQASYLGTSSVRKELKRL